MQSTCVCNTYKMEYNKINNLLGNESENLSKFITRQYVKVNSLSNMYNESKSIRFKTPMFRSDLCDYADAYVLIEGIIRVAGNAPRDNRPDKTDKTDLLY